MIEPAPRHCRQSFLPSPPRRSCVQALEAALRRSCHDSTCTQSPHSTHRRRTSERRRLLELFPTPPCCSLLDDMLHTGEAILRRRLFGSQPLRTFIVSQSIRRGHVRVARDVLRSLPWGEVHDMFPGGNQVESVSRCSGEQPRPCQQQVQSLPSELPNSSPIKNTMCFRKSG